MTKRRRFDVKKILSDPDLRRELMVPTIQATQAREGIETTRDQADRAYYVVTEGERGTFVSLASYRGTTGAEDQRHRVFVECLRENNLSIRFDVPRRDFLSIEGAPLAFQRVGLVAHIFREHPALEPATGVAKQGLATSDDSRWLREWWELPWSQLGYGKRWIFFAKGGSFSRFYYDHDLVIKWADNGRELKDFIIEKDGSETKRIYSQDWYFKRGLTWPRRTAKGLNVRCLPAGMIFADKGPSIFVESDDNENFILGVVNTSLFEYLFQTKTSFSWEVGIMKSMPVPRPTQELRNLIGKIASSIYDAKAFWDEGNEICTRFSSPWLTRADILDLTNSISDRLEKLVQFEASEDARIQKLYTDLNTEVYKLYGIPEKTRTIIEESMGERPPEILWPQMEGKSVEQKRMEHVWRLLSYAVKRVVESDEDGIVPYEAVAGESALVDRVRQELEVLFPDHDANKIEVEIINELKSKVSGYRAVKSIQQWIEDVYFDFHCSLYKNRPIIWHIISKPGRGPQAFGALCHYHKLDSNRMAKLRGRYLRDAIQTFKREAALASQEGRTEDRQEWQAKLEEAQELDRKLQLVQEGFFEGKEGGGRDFRILTPWKSPDERPQGWNPDIDDGVAVNIAPLQRAGVLRKEKVV